MDETSPESSRLEVKEGEVPPPGDLGALNRQTVRVSGNMNMPIIGLGTWLSSNDDIVEKALDSALDAGYRHFDTAFFYRNETAIGKFLKKAFESGKITREELFITTKLPPFGNRPEYVEHFLSKSLSALQLDYVDLYLIHYPTGFKYTEGYLFPRKENGDLDFDLEVDLVALWKKMEEQVDVGRANAIGVSNFNLDQLKYIVDNSRIKPSDIQIELHIYLQEKEIVSYCKENNIVVTSYGSLGSPALLPLTEKFGFSTDGMKKDLVPLNDPVILEIATSHGKTPAQVLLRYLIEYGVVVIPKSSNPERIRENIDIFDFKLTNDEFDRISALDKGEDGRIFCATGLLAGIDEHPLWPYSKK